MGDFIINLKDGLRYANNIEVTQIPRTYSNMYMTLYHLNAYNQQIRASKNFLWLWILQGGDSEWTMK